MHGGQEGPRESGKATFHSVLGLLLVEHAERERPAAYLQVRERVRRAKQVRKKGRLRAMTEIGRRRKRVSAWRRTAALEDVAAALRQRVRE